MIDNAAMFKLSYGLFVLSAKEENKDNGCIINTVTQVTYSPQRITIAVNKDNYTCKMIERTGVFNVSVLTESVPFSLIQHFGFQKGSEVDKFADGQGLRAGNGVKYIEEYTNAFLSGKVISSVDCGTHIVFLADVTEAVVLSDVPSVTYSYYQEHIKPQPEKKVKGYVCKVCGYVYEGDTLPLDFTCPICGHGREDFELLT